MILLAGPAFAQQSVPVAPQPPASAPVTISRLYTQVNNRVVWTTCLNFTNATSKAMTAIQFKLTYVDAFDTPLTTFRADRVGEFSPGVLIEGPENGQITGGGNVDQKIQNCWQVPMVVGSLSAVNAEVAKVRYNDGTIWVAPANGNPVYSGRYMSGIGFVEPPKEISCPGLMFGSKMKWWWIEQYGHGNKKVEPCIIAWEKEHGNLQGWPPAQPTSPEPSPTP